MDAFVEVKYTISLSHIHMYVCNSISYMCRKGIYARSDCGAVPHCNLEQRGAAWRFNVDFREYIKCASKSNEGDIVKYCG